MRQTLLIAFGVILFSVNANSQTSISDFLLTAYEDPNLIGFDKSIEFLRAKNYRLPPIDELEFRFGNDELTNQDQQYAFRINPANPWRIRRNNALFNATRKELSLRKKIRYEQNLVERYELALSYIIASEKATIATNKYTLIKQKVDILANNMESNLFDARDLVDEKLRQIDVLNEQTEINNKRLSFLDEISSILNYSNFDWSDAELITLEIIDSISVEIASRNFSSTQLHLITQQVEVAKREISLEKADFDIGFFQTEYFPFRDRNSDIGFAFGINIPLFKNNKDQLAERKLDEIELQNEFLNEQYQDSLNKKLEYEKLKRLIEQHRMLEQQIQELNIEELYSGLNQIENSDPLVLLDLNEGLLKLEQIQITSKQMLLEQYLEFLETFNVLGHQPFRNYLSNQLEVIE